jgi:tetratricopeptide (TPR) repeat protein
LLNVLKDGLGKERGIPRSISLPTTPTKQPVAANRNHSIAPHHSPTLTTNSSNNTNNNNHIDVVATTNLSPYKRKIEAIGNGWNSEGLQNAKVGQWEKAVYCWENALEIRLQLLGDYHPDVANTWNNMGIALGKMRDHDRAMMCLNRTLEIRTFWILQHSSSGSNTHNQDLEIAATIQNMGNILQQMNDYNGALACFEQAKATQIAVKEDFLVARTCAAMGRLHFENLKLDEALDSYKDALLFYTKAGYGNGDDDYDSVLGDICQTERQLSVNQVVF